MAVRANANSKFLLKFLLIGLASAGYGLYSAYDAFIAYPKKIPISQAWEDLKHDQSLTDGERDKRYKKVAAENGWPSKHPSKKVATIKSDIVYNYIFVVIGLGIGIPCLIWYLRNVGTWIEAEDGKIRSSRGQEFEIEAITQFDKKKWEKKGIGVLTYKSDGGPKTFVVDDLKFAREEMDEIVRLIELRIPHEMIVNGVPESADGEAVED